MRVIRSYLHLADFVNQWTARVALGLVLVIMLIGSYEVVMRGIFNSPSNWTWPLNGQLLVAYIALGGGYNVLVDGHVRMDIFYGRFSPRTKAILDLLTSFVFFAFAVVMVWLLWKFGLHSVATNERTLVLVWHPIMYPIKMVLAVGASLVLLQGIATFIRNLDTAITGKRSSL